MVRHNYYLGLMGNGKKTAQKGEITTLLAIGAVVVMAVGIIAGGRLVETGTRFLPQAQEAPTPTPVPLPPEPTTVPVPTATPVPATCIPTPLTPYFSGDGPIIPNVSDPVTVTWQPCGSPRGKTQLRMVGYMISATFYPITSASSQVLDTSAFTSNATYNWSIRSCDASSVSGTTPVIGDCINPSSWVTWSLNYIRGANPTATLTPVLTTSPSQTPIPTLTPTITLTPVPTSTPVPASGWTIHAEARCYNGTVPAQNGNTSVTYQYWPNQSSSYSDGFFSGQHTISIGNPSETTNIYLFMSYYATNYPNLTPLGNPPSSNINYGTYFSEPAAQWASNALAFGTYTIYFRAPDAWCPGAVPSPTSGPTTVPTVGPSVTPVQLACPRKTEGDAGGTNGVGYCDNSIDGLDYSIWLNSQCHPAPGQVCNLTYADFNTDGNVDDLDYAIWFDHRYSIALVPTLAP